MTTDSSLEELPVATDWWRSERVDTHLTRWFEPYVDPLLRCNVWHLRGRRHDLLVDTGLGVSSLASALSGTFGASTVVVLTHTHADHAGGWAEFDDRRVHHLEAAGLHPESHQPDMGSLLVADVDGDERASMERAGYRMPPTCFLTALPYEGYRPDLDYRPQPAPATTELDEGDVIDLGDARFEVIHVPGHSHGSIGLWDAATGVLFSGDAVYEGPLLDELPGSDIGRYLESMERLALLPVEVVHAGHGPSFGADRLAQLAGTYIDRRSTGGIP